MSKVKYYYDSESLSYKKIERRKRNTFKYASVFLLASALFAFLFVSIAGQYVDKVESFEFLAGVVPGSGLDVHIRIESATFGRLRKYVWSNRRESRKLKLRLYRSLIFPVAIYA